MKENKNKAWAQPDIDKLVDLYVTKGIKDVFFIQEKHFPEKNYRSVVSKLVQLKIYDKPKKELKSTTTVKSVIRQLEMMLSIELDMNNLAKKENYVRIYEALLKKTENNSSKTDNPIAIMGDD